MGVAGGTRPGRAPWESLVGPAPAGPVGVAGGTRSGRAPWEVLHGAGRGPGPGLGHGQEQPARQGDRKARECAGQKGRWVAVRDGGAGATA